MVTFPYVKNVWKFRVLWFIWKFQVVKCFNPLSPRIHTQILLTDWSLEYWSKYFPLSKPYLILKTFYLNMYWYCFKKIDDGDSLEFKLWQWLCYPCVLCPASLTHKNPLRHKIIHRVRSIGCNDWCFDPCVFVEIFCSWNFCGSY